jgi:hypothetical protein
MAQGHGKNFPPGIGNPQGDIIYHAHIMKGLVLGRSPLLVTLPDPEVQHSPWSQQEAQNVQVTRNAKSTKTPRRL